MPKINLRHFLVTNMTGGNATGGPKSGPKNIRYFSYEKPEQPAIFFGFLIFPAAFSATGLLEKLLDELKVEFDGLPVFDEMAFEKIVGFFNNKLGFYASAHKNQKDLAQFDICLAAIIGPKLVFAPLGNISAILFVPEVGHSRYYNLLKEAKGVKSSAELLKLKEIIAGNLTKNNSLIIANEELLNVYSFADLEKLITGVDALTASTNLQTALLTDKLAGSFAGFILETVEAPLAARQNSPSAMKEIIKKRAEVTKIIEAAAPIDLKHASLRAKKVGQHSARLLQNLGAGFWRFSQPLGHLVILFLVALTNWNNQGQENWENIASYLQRGKETMAGYLKQMPLQYKIMSGLALVIIIFFGASVTRAMFQNRLISNTAKFNLVMEKITNWRTDAEVAFIQADDQERSRQLLENALDEIDGFKTKNQAELTAMAEAREQIQNRLFALWKLQSVTLPKPLGALSEILPNEKIVNAFSPDGQQTIAWSVGQIFVVQNNTVAASFRTDEELQNQFYFDNGLLTIRAKNQNRLVQLSPNEQKIYVAEIEDFKGHLVNFVILKDKLYALQNENLFITKHAKSLTGFARGAAWLKEPIDIKEAVAVAIDENLYTTSATGEIKKMYNGRLAEFNQEWPEPKITSVNKIWTSENTRLLFLVNNPDARLIIYDKKGAVISQLRFTTITQIKNFYINDSARIPAVSIFDGANVYYLDLAPYL